MVGDQRSQAFQVPVSKLRHVRQLLRRALAPFAHLRFKSNTGKVEVNSEKLHGHHMTTRHKFHWHAVLLARTKRNS